MTNIVRWNPQKETHCGSSISFKHVNKSLDKKIHDLLVDAIAGMKVELGQALSGNPFQGRDEDTGRGSRQHVPLPGCEILS